MDSPLPLATSLFASVPEHELARVLESLHQRRESPGKLLFLEGDRGDCFYIVAEGELEVIKAYGTPDERLLNVRGRGEHIGEMSFLIPDGLRTATVRCRTSVRLLEMDRETFEAMLHQWPGIARDIARLLSQRLRDSENTTLADLREKNRQLNAAFSELRQMSSQLLSAQENERKRIASELHDSVGQLLTATKFGLESSLHLARKIVEGPLVERLETLVQIVRDTIREVRRISKDLRPSMLDDLGVLATIEWFCREFHAVYAGIAVQKEIRIHEEEISVPLKTILFRIVQEAFNNVAKHSGARTVRLSLRSSDGEVQLLIQDDGRGIDLSKQTVRGPSEVGLGLAGMKERAELSGGTFSVESIVESGTVIRATWPLGR